MTEERQYYTVVEVQKLLGISRTTVYNLLKKREFHWIMIGGNAYRISRTSFDSWLEERMRSNKDIIGNNGESRKKADAAAEKSFAHLCDILSRSAQN